MAWLCGGVLRMPGRRPLAERVSTFAFAPGGRSLQALADVDRNGFSGTLLSGPPGGPLAPLAAGVADWLASPDGDRLAIIESWDPKHSSGTLWEAAALGGKAVGPLDEGVGNRQGSIAFTDDGKLLLYLRRAGRGAELREVSSRGGPARTLARGVVSFQQASAGEVVAAVRDPAEGRIGLLILDI